MMNPTILYVEDDSRSRKIMQMILNVQLDITNLILMEDSANFPERIAALDPQPDIIFLDIHVKPFSGFEMLDMLRAKRRYDNIPVVALTASVMNEEIQRLRSAGFNGCLAKPIDQDTFPQALERLLNGEPVWSIIY